MNLLQEKLSNLPSSPGVYLMKNSQGTIIYVGKSKHLKNRVQSYFQNRKDLLPKIKKLVKSIYDIEIMTTDTEFEALMLECSLIKKIKPLYNRKMKNPQSFLYIVINSNEGYRRISVTNEPNMNTPSLYFGPFTARNSVEKAVEGLKDSFKLNCSNSVRSQSPCLNYSLGKCIGVCNSEIEAKQYDDILNKLISLLSGKNLNLLNDLEQMMIDASDRFDFEEAAKYRDTIDAINIVIQREKLIEFTEKNNYILIIERLDEHTLKLFLIQRTKFLLNETYDLRCYGSDRLQESVKAHIVSTYKSECLHSHVELSRDEIDEAQIIYSYLKGGNCSYVVIEKEWLTSNHSLKIDEEINKLLTNEKLNIKMPSVI